MNGHIPVLLEECIKYLNIKSRTECMWTAPWVWAALWRAILRLS